MFEWKVVTRCKECGMMYPGRVPLVCCKCGGKLDLYSRSGLVSESVIARRVFWWWEIKEKLDY